MKKLTILFVDDEENILKALKRSLMDEDYRTIFTTNGEEALKILEKEEVHVLVADMKMPDMDGLTLLKIVKQKYPRIVRIVLSGYTQLSQILATVNQADIFRYMTKPWKMEEEFREVLKQAIEYYRLQEEREELNKALEKKNQLYVNIIKNTEKKYKEIKYNFIEIKEFITNSLSYINDNFCNNKTTNISPLINFIQQIVENLTMLMPSYTTELNMEKLKNDINRFIADKISFEKKVIYIDKNIVAQSKSVTINYNTLFLCIIEILSVLFNVEQYSEVTVTFGYDINKIIILIPLSTDTMQQTYHFINIIGILANTINGNIKFIKSDNKKEVIVFEVNAIEID